VLSREILAQVYLDTCPTKSFLALNVEKLVRLTQLEHSPPATLIAFPTASGVQIQKMLIPISSIQNSRYHDPNKNGGAFQANPIGKEGTRDASATCKKIARRNLPTSNYLAHMSMSHLSTYSSLSSLSNLFLTSPHTDGQPPSLVAPDHPLLLLHPQ
jgi:hypothetical protein